MTDWLYSGKVVRVVDGDTVVIDLDMGMKVWQLGIYLRISGIDAPELSSAEGKAARAYAASLLPVGAPVRVRSHSFEKYGRLLASVEFSGQPPRDFAAEMLAAGHAKTW